MIKHIAYSYQYENQLLSFKNIFTTVVRSILASNTPLTWENQFHGGSKGEQVEERQRGETRSLVYFKLLFFIVTR